MRIFMENRQSTCVAQARRVKRKGTESSTSVVLCMKCAVILPGKWVEDVMSNPLMACDDCSRSRWVWINSAKNQWIPMDGWMPIIDQSWKSLDHWRNWVEWCPATSGEAQMHRARCDHAERILEWYENHVAPCEVKARETQRFLALFELLMSIW